jgi:eukaryotic-like serine/threonine-protein kinase
MESGKVFLHFVVVNRIGKGGMGDVYLAEDKKLGRKVALKFLPQEFVQHEDRLRRFEQEARAASALNHPNILTIFEIGEAEGHHFIASEFIEGETLRDRIAHGGALSIQQAIDIAVQIATALTAAHSAKITHRDLKPENIMIRKDGYVKILDFGLAKQQQSTSEADQGSVFQTKTFAQTEPGTVLGTFPYMSPEQARGLDLDSRTDLFSLGTVLYEMIAGRNPFDRATRSDVIAAILQQEPAQLSTFVAEVRPELEWIVNKALRKDREERYQTAREMMGDLKRLQQNSGPTDSTISTAPKASGPVTPTVSSAEYVVREIKKRKIAAVALFLALVAGLIVWRTTRPQEQAAVQKQGIRISRLTTSGTVGEAAISPDGRLVVYSAATSGKEGLWLKQIATGSNISIVPPEDISYHGLTFTPDGNFIFAARNDPRTQATSLYKIPVLGGSASKMLDQVDSSPAISPDGKRIAFVRYESNHIAKLLTAAIDGSSIRTELELRSPEFIDNKTLLWSHDGTRIVYSGGRGDDLPSLFETVLGSGKSHPVSDQWGDFDGIAFGLAWNKAENVLLASAAHSSTNWFYQIWAIPTPGGVAQRVTNDPNNYIGLSGSADSKSFVTVQNDRLSDIWVIAADGKSPAKQVTFERYDGRTGLVWTPDKKILFGNRNFDLWLMDADGSNRKILTVEEHSNRVPAISQDGKYIAFESWRKSPRGQTCALWIMTIEGTNPKWVAPTQCYMTATSAGDSFLFDRHLTGKGIWKVSRNGGDPVQIINEEVHRPMISPDGSKIASIRLNGSVSVVPEIEIYSISGGSPLKKLPTTSGFDEKILRWTPDGNGIAFINTEAGVSNLWVQTLDGAAPKQITHFDGDEILFFDWAKDGRIAVARGKTQNDVMLIQID